MRQYYEPLMEFGHTLIEPGDTVIDGGANLGIFTCAFAAAVGPQGRVIAFEPLPYAYDALADNIRANGFDNCEPHRSALSNQNGETKIDVRFGPVRASIVRDFGGTDVQTIPTCTIDSLNVSRVDFIKLDAEGAELAAIEGTKATLCKFKPIVCVESTLEDEYGPVSKILVDMGYQPFRFDDNGDLIALTNSYHLPQCVLYQLYAALADAGKSSSIVVIKILVGIVVALNSDQTPNHRR